MAADTFEFTMPSLGADMDEGKLVEWLVKPGDEVAKGDIVAVVETAKSTIEVECFHPGVVDKLIVEPGTTVPVGAPLATMSSGRATEPSRPAAVPAESTPATPAPGPVAGDRPPVAGPLIRRLASQLGVDLSAVHGTGHDGAITRADVRRAASRQPEPAPGPQPPPPPAGVRISPFAQQLADKLGVDLATVTGTGRAGAIRAEDVRAAAERKPTEPAAAAERAEPTEQPAPVSRKEAATDRNEAMRQVTARLMARSKREIPHYYLRTTVDVTDTLAWVRERNRELPITERILPAGLFLRATALAATEVPALNGYWQDDAFVPSPTVNLGLPVSLRGGGLITPAIADAAQLDLADLAVKMRDLATRAKAGRLRGSELTGATITVTNLGELGVELVYGVIYPPQVALVGIGKIVERPWAVDGELRVRSIVTITLSADHRATDGATGARFLSALSRALNQPERM
ncbi:MAG TPA: 2-oxo acid dehydrogenase subunit E2 [Jiangellaceae bacterium]